jgi:hypothetical protein
MVSSKVIYTVICGGKDELCEDINTQGALAVCFTDNPKLKSKVWEIRQIPNLFKDIRRDSRMVKMLPHIYFPEAEYSLYLDANVICKIPMVRLINEWLQDTDIALFKHSTRNCLFDEAKECILLGLDTKQVIESHIMRYKGFPKQKGLYQGGVILRRHTGKIQRLNEMWWAEYCSGCKRDQVSLPYCIEKLGVPINAINSHAWIHPYFEMFNHKIPSEWAYKLDVNGKYNGK